MPGIERSWLGMAALISESQLPHKIVDLSFTITNIKNKLTNLCGNGLLQDDFKTTLCEINLPGQAQAEEVPGIDRSWLGMAA